MACGRKGRRRIDAAVEVRLSWPSFVVLDRRII
jgi:hypothetical protein